MFKFFVYFLSNYKLKHVLNMFFRINLKSKYLKMAEILSSVTMLKKRTRCNSYRTYLKQTRLEFS